MPNPVPFAIPSPIPFDDLLSLKGRVAIVTGGSRGLGEAMVWRLAQAGAFVVATARGKPALDKLEAEIVAAGGTMIGVQADASSLEDNQKVIDLAVSRFGKIDILVNNAAIFPGSLSIEISERLWNETVDTDMKGAFFLSKFAALEMIKAGKGGKIINILSAEMLQPTGFLAAYGAAKAGLMAITQSMAKELGEYGIQVNAVIPGATMTQERIDALSSGHVQGAFETVPADAPKTVEKQRQLFEQGNFAQVLGSRLPLRRPGYPDDLAKAVLFMASDMASYVSGTSLLVDGAQGIA